MPVLSEVEGALAREKPVYLYRCLVRGDTCSEVPWTEKSGAGAFHAAINFGFAAPYCTTICTVELRTADPEVALIVSV